MSLVSLSADFEPMFELAKIPACLTRVVLTIERLLNGV